MARSSEIKVGDINGTQYMCPSCAESFEAKTKPANCPLCKATLN